MSLDVQIEGVLFYKSAPVKISALAESLNVSEEELQGALVKLETRLASGATRLVQTDKEVQLVTAPETAETIESLRKDELKKDIGKAGAETLAIILYRGPISRAEIDRIRGVNSTFILRNLLVRGLVERQENTKDQRAFLYAATTELYTHLGITKREELPQYADVMNEIDAFEQLAEEQSKTEAPFG